MMDRSTIIRRSQDASDKSWSQCPVIFAFDFSHQHFLFDNARLKNPIFYLFFYLFIYFFFWILVFAGPLYRLPCSSTMSTYVPATMATSSPGQSNHQHRPATTIGFNDVRTSTSFQSFNGGGNDGEARSRSGGVSSLYSLSDSHCPSPVAMMTAADSNPISNIDQLSAAHRQSEMMRGGGRLGGCHHLYWSRPLARTCMAPSVIGSNSPGSDSQLVSVRLPGNTSQGSVNRSKLSSLRN
jgi:hypothetical protein